MLQLLNTARLALFAIGYGLTGALVGSTLNRVMIVDLNLPVTLVGLFFAVPLFIAPTRAWVGYVSDTVPLFGKHREPYMLLGTLLASIGVLVAIMIVVALYDSGFTGIALLVIGGLLAFGLHEFGRNMAHNAFYALLADRFEGANRTRAITLFEVSTILGLTAGAGGIGSALKDYEAGRLIVVTLGVALVTLVLTVIATLRSEPAPQQQYNEAHDVDFRTALREIIFADSQVRLFFIVLTLGVTGTLAQDVLLEPYGGLVLDMDLEATTRLTAFWGLGVMLAMLVSGLLLVRRVGYLTLLRIGLGVTMVVFVGVIMAGISESAAMFRMLVLVMGLGTGIAGAAMLAGIITFTTKIRAGLLMGVWSIAMLAGRSLGGLVGGILVDSMTLVGATHLLAYGVVFALEGMLLLAALLLSLRLNVQTSAAYVEAQSAVPIVTLGATATVA